MRPKTTFALKFSFLVVLAACTAQPPIVADPPEHERLSAEPVPWEEEYGRAMMKSEAVPKAAPDPHAEQRFNGQLADAEDRGAFDVVADVLAFPFRAIGWLFQSIF
jgi:hypothetical protein